MESQPRKTYSLRQLTESIQSIIRKTYVSDYWIKAEMARLNHYPHSGHCYPDLVDKEGDVVRAQMRGIIWANDYKRIARQFVKLTGKPLQDDLEILFRARVEFNPKFGLNLQILDIDPHYTLGQMLAEKQACIQRLKAEGLFNKNKSLPFPELPQRIALISVESSKGYNDLLQVFDHNPGPYVFRHQLFPSLLQGEKAVQSIIWQLDNIRDMADDFDLVAIVRGGGGEIGLSAYDHYDLASAISRFPLPVLTGIGHSTNETVSEMVAWHNAITPTELGFFLVQKMEELEALIGELAAHLSKATLSHLRNEEYKHVVLAQSLKNFSQKQLHNFANELGRKEYLLGTHSRMLLSRQKEQFEYLSRILQNGANNKLQEEESTIESHANDIRLYKGHLLQQYNHLTYLSEKIKLMDPHMLLKKGYSISTVNGKLIKDPEKLKEGDILRTRTLEAEIESTINKVQLYDKEAEL